MIIKDRIRTFISFTFFLLLAVQVSAQSYVSQALDDIEKRLSKDVYTLASDSFMGRETGTKGEIMARDYIVENFKQIGLQPGFEGKTYIQSYTFKDAPVYGDSNFLNICNKTFTVDKDYYALPFSSSATVSAGVVFAGYGLVVPSKNYDDYNKLGDIKGKIVILESGVPADKMKDTVFAKYSRIEQRIDAAASKGAVAVIFITSEKNGSRPANDLTKRVMPAGIPVIYAEQAAAKQLKKVKRCNISLRVNIYRKTNTGYNVAGFINNNATNTIVIGAHYDHLGYGGENSMSGGTLTIHNGADDNASGTAAMMELARYLEHASAKNHNYLLLGFSGEEKGLLGSSYYVKSGSTDLSKVSCMLNLDMVGRYDSTKIGLNIIGTGTSDMWDTIIDSVSLSQKLKVKKSRTGFSGSDHMSFYLKDIPVLFFFTGIHTDYHKPSDDADKINYYGEARIVKYVESLILAMDTVARIPFIKAVDSASVQPAFSVTLGVVPDHSYDGKGMRIEVVHPGKPAANAGLISGDIVIKIGDFEVSEIMSYMKALGKFKKGQKTTVTVKRGEEILIKEIQF